jgi:site-specific DNA-methyltransferase (adenine-specific)
MTREIVASKKQDWGTPRPFFNVLQAEYGFTLDVCAAFYNATLPRYYGPGSPVAEDGLRVSWAGERCFCNPPYEDIESWLRKGLLECAEGAFSVFLIPANTDTRWFHEYAVVGQIDFVKGRLSFEDLTPPKIELPRVLALYNKKPAKNLLKQMALLLNELDPAQELKVLAKRYQFYEGDDLIEEAAFRCHKALGLDEWPTETRKPGPGFPSMLVAFDPNAAAGPRTYRTRSAKTGELL